MLRRLVRSLTALAAVASVTAYETSITDKDAAREVCSGMWAGDDTYINVTFSDKSSGRLAMVIYEFSDMDYLGKVTIADDEWPVVTWICTSDALRANLCSENDLGKFIVDLPSNMSISDTSIWSASVQIGNSTTSPSGDASSGFWNPPGGTPALPGESSDDGPTNWRRAGGDATYHYDGKPIHYKVSKTGYYCVGTVPVTYLENDMTVPSHGSFEGDVLFQNAFKGKLPAADYPKIRFYNVMTGAYLLLACAWGFLCFKHKEDILPIQVYISALVGFLVTEMLASWTYYRYLNAHGEGTSSVIFLIVVAIISAGRNALSFFLLLVVALGLSVVREEIPFMRRCQILAVAHFVFGVMYAIAVVEIQFEVVSLSTLLLFVMPLSFTLTTFLLWIMYGLQGTLAELTARKQTYKLGMFKRLYYILIGAVLVIIGFFVVTSMSFSARYEEDFASKTWKYRWWLMDGYLTILFLLVFAAIAFLWRPTGNNRRLAMSTELAQDEDDAEGRDAEAYDLEAMQNGHQMIPKEDDEGGIRLHGREESLHAPLDEDNVVFEIGDEDDDEHHHQTQTPRATGGSANGGYEIGDDDHDGEHEGQGLMNGRSSRIDKRLD